MSRNLNKEERENFLECPYERPQQRVPRETTEDEQDSNEVPDIIFDEDDSGYDTSDGETSFGYMFRSHGDSISILHELLEAEKQENAYLASQLANEKEHRKAVETETTAAQKAAKECT